MVSCPTYFERFPSREDYEGCKRLKEWYPPDKFPSLNRQWDRRIAQYEIAMSISQ